MSNMACKGCGGTTDVGYFYAATPGDLRRLATSSARIYQVELGFETGSERRSIIERRLQRLQSECGCDAAALSFAFTVAIIWIAPQFRPARISEAIIALLSCIAIAVACKILVIAIARLRILWIARRLARESGKNAIPSSIYPHQGNS